MQEYFYSDALLTFSRWHCHVRWIFLSTMHINNIFTGPPTGPVLFFDCWRLSSSVTLSTGGRGGSATGRVGGRPPPGRARGRSCGRHCMAGQCGYFPLPPIGVHSIAIWVTFCLIVCSYMLKSTHPNFTKFYIHESCTSGLMDHVIFSSEVMGQIGAWAVSWL